MRTWILVPALLAVCSGCETLNGPQRRLAETRLYNEVANIRMDMQRLDQRIAGLEAEREILHARIEDIQSGCRQSEARQNAELAAISARLRDQTAEQGRIRQELTDDLSARMAKIMQAQAASAAAAVRTQAGYVHVVKTGQTLSEIAREYKVGSAAIIKANNLKKPDDLRVGQELFIPE